MNNPFAKEIGKKYFIAIETSNFSSMIIGIISWLSISIVPAPLALTLEPFRAMEKLKTS